MAESLMAGLGDQTETAVQGIANDGRYPLAKSQNQRSLTARMINVKCVTTLTGCLCLYLSSCTSVSRQGPLKPADKVDLSRYMGPWCIIACTDNKVECDFVDAAETYRFSGSRRVDVHFAWRDKSFSSPVKIRDFTGRITSDGSNARWKMKIFPLLSARNVIIAVAPDYSSEAVAHPSRKFGWILARERTLPEKQYARYLQLFPKQGYDTSIFVKVPQRAEQLQTVVGK
jgi:apolipoprotein D and lipocalin family protein